MDNDIVGLIYDEFIKHNLRANEILLMTNIRITLYSFLPVEKKKLLIPCLNQMVYDGKLKYNKTPQESISLTEYGFNELLKYGQHKNISMASV